MPKLHRHLRVLLRSEHKAFRRFLRSPYHNRNPKLAELFELLAPHLYAEPPRHLPETEAAAALFPGQPFDQNRYRKLATALLHCFHDFLRHQEFRAQPATGEFYLLRRFVATDQTDLVPKQISQTSAALTRAEWPAPETNDMVIAIGLEVYKFEARQAGRRPETQPAQLLDRLEQSYAIRKMKLLYMQLNHFRITGEGTEPNPGDFLSRLAPQIGALPLEAILYFHLFICTRNPAETEAYRTLRALLTHQADKLFPDDAEDIYAGVLNYCTQQINRGQVEYLREMWTVYVEMQLNHTLDQDGGIPRAHFKNMLTIAARLGEFAWAESVLRQYETTHPDAAVDNAINFGRGILEFYRARPQAAIRHFHRVLDHYEDLFFGLDARVYLLRIYYETGDVTGLDALCDSFRMFLKRNQQLPRSRKANYNHFVNYLRRLSRIPRFEGDRLRKLRHDIASGRRISATNWLLREIDGLISDD
ncbi:MAG: hypothetical protein AAF998_12045 [Bacteroidota bacterium]